MSQLAKEILRTIQVDGESPAKQGNWPTTAAYAVELVFLTSSSDEVQTVLSPWYFAEGEEDLARSAFAQKVELAKVNTAKMAEFGINQFFAVRLYGWDLGPEVLDAFQTGKAPE